MLITDSCVSDIYHISGLVTPADAGLITPSGLTSIPAGMETPDAIELRKKIEDSMESGGGDTPALYQVREWGILLRRDRCRF